MRAANLLPLLLSLGWLAGCDLRGLFGESFLRDVPDPCAACPPGHSCDEAGACAPPPDLAPPPCTAHEHCGPAALCRLDESFPGAELAAVGACIPAARTCVIDGDACIPGGDGSAARPLCDPQEALSRGGRCAFALLVPRADGGRYGELRAQAGALVLVGPGRDAGRGAALSGADVRGGASLTLVGLTLENPGRVGARCSEGASLALREVAVQGSEIGVEARGCARLTIEASRVSGNENDGLHIEAQEYRVVNTLVLGNAFESGVAASGVYIKGGRGAFAFNTVVGNGRMGQDGGGVSCTGGPERFVPLSDSVVSDNGVGPMGTQFLGSCEPARLVVGSDTLAAPGAIKMDPQLDPVNLRLTERSDCCIDRAEPDATVRRDYEGTARPQGTGPDIGFHELRR